MSLESKRRIDALIDAANAKTGGSDTTLTDAVQTLCDGFGQGGGSVERTAWYRPPDWPDITSLPINSDGVIEAWYTVDKNLPDAGDSFQYVCTGYSSYFEYGEVIDGVFVATEKFYNSDSGQYHCTYTIDLQTVQSDFPVLHYHSRGTAVGNTSTNFRSSGFPFNAPIVEAYSTELHISISGNTTHGNIKAVTIAPNGTSVVMAGLSDRPLPKGASIIDLSGFNGITVSSRCLYIICQNMYALKEFKLPSVAQNSILLGTASQSDWPSQAFQNCYALQELDLSAFDTSEVTKIQQMFDYCYSLRTLNISGWNLAACTNVSNAFRRCTALVNLITDGVTLPSVAISFSDCTALSVDSLNGIIAALPTLEDGTALTLTLGSTNTAKLTEAEIAVATEKGWTVA